MKFYDCQTAPSPRRARIFIAEKGLDIETVEIDLGKAEQLSDDFKRKNPRCTVPVLELDDGRYLAESSAICRYFDELQPSPPLFGTGLKERAMVELWHRRMEFELALPIIDAVQNSHAFFADRTEQLPEFAERCRSQALESLCWLDTVLAEREFVAGDEYTVADIVAFVGVEFGRLSDIRVDPNHTNVSRWHAEVSARPSAGA